MNMLDQYKKITSSSQLSAMDKKLRIQKLYDKTPIYNKPPRDSNYDNYGDSKIFRYRRNGMYPEIKLALGERPLGDPNKFANALSDPSTVVISDIRIDQFVSRTSDITRAINNRCHSTGDLLLIGDVLHPKVSTSFPLLLNFLNDISTHNVYLILGKDDIFSASDYISFGFSYVTDRAEKTIDGKKVIFTYYPVPLSRNQYNIHGSLLGSYQYPHMSKDNHYDAYIKDDSQQLKIRNMGEILNELRGDN